MIEDKEIGFTNKLVIQGNSYCVRIPKVWVDKLGLKEGQSVDVTIRKPKEEMSSEKLLLPYKKHLSQLKDFSLADINSCLFYIGMESAEDMEEKQFEEKLKKEKGKEFLEKYRIFKEAVKDKEAMKKVIENSMKASQLFTESFELAKETAKQ